MIYKGCEIVTTLNRQGKWYAVVIDETAGVYIETSPDAFCDRLSAIRDGRSMVDRIVAEREGAVVGASRP